MIMRYTNLLFTYLLTYLLISVVGFLRDFTSCIQTIFRTFTNCGPLRNVIVPGCGKLCVNHNPPVGVSGEFHMNLLVESEQFH